MLTDMKTPKSANQTSQIHSSSSSWDFHLHRSCMLDARRKKETTHIIIPQKWLKKSYGTLALVGFVVGQRNVCHFPYLCYVHGGQFIFVYLVCVLTIAMPIMLFEVTLGQFSSSGPFRSFDIMPAFRGVTITSFITGILDASTNNILISWSLYYLYISFVPILPWDSCGKWSTPLCQTNLKSIDNITCIRDSTLTLYPNGTCYNTSSNTLYGISDRQLALRHNITPILPAKDYLYNVGFMKDDKEDKTGYLRVDLSLFLFAAWFIDYAALVAGLKRSIYLQFFAVIYPLSILVLLFIFSVMQEGSNEGLSHILRFDYTKLLDGDMWQKAMRQAIFSLSVCIGGHINFASKNTFHTNPIKRVFVVCAIDTIVSIYAAIIVLNFIGSFARDQRIDFDKVANGQIDMMYVIYPQAVATFPWAPFWSIMSFATVVTLGLDSHIHQLNIVLVTIMEMFPFLYCYRLHVTTCLCMILFGLGLIMSIDVFKIMGLITMMDFGWIFSVVILTNSCIIMLYGPMRFTKDIIIMVGKGKWSRFLSCFRWWFIICTCFICPTISLTNIIYSLYTLIWTTGMSRTYTIINFVFQILTVTPIIATLTFSFISSTGSVMDRLKSIKSSKTTWGPYLVKHRRLVSYVKRWLINPRGLGDGNSAYEITSLRSSWQ